MAESIKSRTIQSTRAKHNYATYVKGCSCDECRVAKRTYIRTKRQKAAQLRIAYQLGSGDRYVASGIRHGYSGYVEHSCRCDECRAAKAKADHARSRRRQRRQR